MVLPQKVEDLWPHANTRVEPRVRAGDVGAQLDQIFSIMIGRERLTQSRCARLLLGGSDRAGEPADGVQNVDGRIVILGRELSRKDDVAVENGAHRVADGLVEIVALHQHGKEAGDGSDNHPFAEFTPDELAQMLGEELQLPNIELKGKKSTETTRDRYNKISMEGPTGLRHMPRTYKEALKRTMSTGDFNPDDPYVIPIKKDFRYKAANTIVKPEISVVVHYLRDYSGSITPDMCHQIKSSVFWIDLWLKHQYKKIESRYFVHDTVCEELDNEKFFGVSEGGGTKVSAGYEKIIEAMAEEPDANHYLFQWSDGDNAGHDDTKCIELVNTKILPMVNLFGYGQVAEVHAGDLYTTLSENIKHEKFVCATTLTADDIMKTMKAFLGTGK